MRTTNPAKVKILELAEKIVFPDATEQNTVGVVSKPPDGFTKVTEVYLKEESKELVLIT